MRENTASKTSMLVAMLRAMADAGVTSVKGFSDPTARHLISGFWARRYESAKGSSGLRRAAASRGADLMALRTLAIDGALVEGLKRGATQLVILGAGLDGRAFRMPELKDVRVFEVDHPATQAYKRERLAALTPTASNVAFVAVDFERDSLNDALAAAGHRAEVPTVWVWEGVIVYLTDAALRATLNVVTRRSAPSSTLLAQYNVGGENNLGVGLLFAAWGERPLGVRSKEVMTRELEAVGLRIVQDTGNADWAHASGAQSPKRSLGARLAVAVK